DTSDVDKLLKQGFKGKTLGRGASGADAKTLQGTLRALGYLPKDAKLTGKMDADTTNALMAFQVATSGVDKVEKGTDAQGRAVYQTDKDKNRLKGIVTGKLDKATRAKLTEALKTERADRLAGRKEDKSKFSRTMGDNDTQRKQIADRMRKQGLDPEKLMKVDTSRFAKQGLRPHVLDAAIDAWENAYASGKTKNMTITVNDFELPGNMRRSFTLDLSKPGEGLKMHELMAHGSGSGDQTWSTKFSGAQRTGSGQSVLGGMIVGGRSYPGSKQYGATVDGLEKGINDRADAREVRMHAKGRGSLSEDAIGRSLGYRSLGCLVMTDKAAKTYRDQARKEGGRYNFNFSPNAQYWGNKKNAVTSD
ncbi:MAG: murein L,D-transpeptidase catalytic domain family protein, partial [Myxococcales bacterium]|nr:murein L,D-transpeptidase catalytic domain family protein [Myxococcales bacterium]